MSQVFIDALNRKLESIYPDVSNRLHRLDELPDLIQQEVVAGLLSHACQSQHVGNILAAKDAIATIPRQCVSRVLDAAIHKGVDLADEWEYRRLLEVLREMQSDRLKTFIALGLTSDDVEIREAAEDFKAR